MSLATVGFRTLPAFGCVLRTPTDTHVLVRGNIQASFDGQVVSATNATTWSEAVTSPSTTVRLSIDSADTQPTFFSSSGIVPASLVECNANDAPRVPMVDPVNEEPGPKQAFVDSTPAATSSSEDLAPVGAENSAVYEDETFLVARSALGLPPASQPPEEPGMISAVPSSPAPGAPISGTPFPTTAAAPSGPIDPFGASPFSGANSPTSQAVPQPKPAIQEGDHFGDTVTFEALRSTTPERITSTGHGVQAVHCPARHPNPVHASHCRICASPIADRDQLIIPRPTLGWLTLSAVLAYPLDRDMVFGRSPSAPARAQQPPRLVVIGDQDEQMSRSHLHVTIIDWQVFAADLGSLNGTMITLPDRNPQQLRANEPTLIIPGTVVEIGSERLEYTTGAP